jgi:hypothetical protein
MSKVNRKESLEKIMIKAIKQKIRYTQFALAGDWGGAVSLNSRDRLTVLITYYHPARMGHIQAQVRNILRCEFVERLIVSNHNPAIRIEDKVQSKDKRLTLLNQTERRGCGYRWVVAHELSPKYLVVIDDDMFLFPGQIAKLFRCLIDEPEIPHGVAGMIRVGVDSLEYHEVEDIAVDYLCETYAVTNRQLERYIEMKKAVATNDILTAMIDNAADFMVISQTGSARPKIHNVGRLFKSSTFKEVGIAVHKQAGFDESLMEVDRALNAFIVQDMRNRD